MSDADAEQTQYKLEERVCKCGCGRRWRCLPTSTSEFFSNVECPEMAGKKRLRMVRMEFVNHKKQRWGFTGYGG